MSPSALRALLLLFCVLAVAIALPVPREAHEHETHAKINLTIAEEVLQQSVDNTALARVGLA
jgi:hypothetical protein